jgi:hypothetical protein
MIFAVAFSIALGVFLIAALVYHTIRTTRQIVELSRRVEDVEDVASPVVDRVVARVVVPGNGPGSISTEILPARVVVPRGREGMSRAIAMYGLPGRTWRPATDSDPMAFPRAFVTRWGHA